MRAPGWGQGKPGGDKQRSARVGGSHLEALQLRSAKEGWHPRQGQLVPDLAPNGPGEDS